MDVKGIRRANVGLLVQEVGSVTALAKLAGTAQSYLSQIIGPRSHRALGDDLARRLEYVTRKPTGWLDSLHVEDAKLSKCRAIYDVLLALPPEKVDALITLFDLQATPGSLGRINLEAIPRRKTGPRLVELEQQVENHAPTRDLAKAGDKSARGNRPRRR